ncbi:MAG: glycosyltransferase family 4 protein [Pseudomonadota bacterium]
MSGELTKILRDQFSTLRQTVRGRVSRKDCVAVLDARFYTAQNPDIAKSGHGPVSHFRQFGMKQNRVPNPWFSEAYVHSTLHQDSLRDEGSVAAYVESGLAQKPRLIFVSHDASRTGAPAIILRLLEMFSESGAFECFSILDKGGERLDEFKAVSHTYVMSRQRYDPNFSDEQAFAEIAKLLGADGVFARNRPLCALVNSAESLRIGRSIAQFGVPVVSLIHEIASYYPPQNFEQFGEFSERLVFPSEFVRKAAERHTDADRSKMMVRGQGLLEDDFGTLDRESCRKQLRRDLNLEDDAFIVLNVGTIEIRKGVDLFVDLAKLFFDRDLQDRPVYFVWFGQEMEEFDYAREFLQRHDLTDRVRLMPSTSEIERVFLGGDLFLLSARGDPFPCVIHEAMVCGLPVIAFRDGGGAPELIGDDCGTIVEMANLRAAADAIQAYLDNPDKHAEHSSNAKRKIERDWGYGAYCDDIYSVIQECVPGQNGSWPALTAVDAPEHLVIMHGTARDLGLLGKLDVKDGQQGLSVAIINGRFGRETDATIRTLSRQGLRYRICQPVEDTVEAREAVVARLLRKPRPGRVTLVDTLGYTTPEQLQLLPYPKFAAETGEALTLEQMAQLLPYLEELGICDAGRLAELNKTNPACETRLRLLERP